MKRGTLMGKKPSAEPAPTPAEEAAPAAARIAPAKAKTREGKRNVTAFIDEPAHKQLRLLATTEDAAMQDLFVEALNLLFEARGLPRIA